MQDLSPSDSDLSQLGWRRGSHSGFREGDSRQSDRRPDRAKPQVTRAIGVFDPYRTTTPVLMSVLACTMSRADAGNKELSAVVA